MTEERRQELRKKYPDLIKLCKDCKTFGDYLNGMTISLFEDELYSNYYRAEAYIDCLMDLGKVSPVDGVELIEELQHFRNEFAEEVL